MISIFSYDKNSTGIFDKSIIFIMFLFSIILVLLTKNNIYLNSFLVIVLIKNLTIFFRFANDEYFKIKYFIYFILLNTILIDFFIPFFFELTNQNTDILFCFMFLSPFLISFLFQYCKLQSYKKYKKD